MDTMFANAPIFNQPINTWNVDNVYSFASFRDLTQLSDENTPPKFL
jgi:hypothetical protein